RSTCARLMVGRRSPQSPSINRLTSPPDQILSKCRRSRHQIPTPLATAPGAVALYCLDLKWKQRIKVTCPHQMIDIESVGGSTRAIRRRERKGEIAGCRQPAFIAMVQQILLGRPDHFGRPRPRGRDAFAEDEGFT